jgi:S1-C subfamily serine protease
MDGSHTDAPPSETRTWERPDPPVWPTSPPPVPVPPPAPAGGPRSGPLVLAGLVGALVATLVAVPLALWLQPAPAAVRFDAAASPVAAVAEAVLPSVARVDVVTAQGVSGSGSAVIFRADGHLLTNAHVVEGAAQVSVTLPEGTSTEARIVGEDPRTDLAVLRIGAARPLPVPAFAEELPRIGDTAIAIGSPFGLEGSVTAGVVSALHRTVPTGQTRPPLIDVIQTDAPINPGNSGGALVNASAEIVGINTAIFAGSGQGNIGIGFAIPINTALSVAEQLVDQGFVEHAQLGVVGEPLDPGVAERYELPISGGAVVREVMPGSAAEDAGVEPGDIIVGLDGEEIATMSDLITAILRRSPGDEVDLEVFRRDSVITLEATLGASGPTP